MALLFVDGFDHYDPQALDAHGQPWLARGKAAYLSPQAQRIAGRRPSSHALRLPAGPGGGYIYNHPVSPSGGGLIVGAALRLAPWNNSGEAPVLLGLEASNGVGRHFVTLEPGARLALHTTTVSWGALLTERRAISVSSAPARGWHYLELRIDQHATLGLVEVWLNGVLAIRHANSDTLSAGAPLQGVFVGALPGYEAHATLDLDDLYLADTSGSINNNFLGDVRVDTLRARAPGSLNGWSVEPASLAAWQAVSDGDDTSAVRSNAALQRQSFAFEPLPAMSSPALHGVQVTVLARKTDAGAGAVRALAQRGASLSVSAPLTLQEQLAWHSAAFERDPNGNAQWSEAAFNAAEFGLESP